MLSVYVPIWIAATAAQADLSCQLNQPDPWSPEITAVVCEDVSGVFVASSIYTRLSKRDRGYGLLEAELALKSQEAGELRLALGAGDRRAVHLEAALATTSSVSRSLMQDVESLAGMASREWHESRALWFSVGFAICAGVVALTAWAYSQIDGKLQIVTVP